MKKLDNNITYQAHWDSRDTWIKVEKWNWFLRVHLCVCTDPWDTPWRLSERTEGYWAPLNLQSVTSTISPAHFVIPGTSSLHFVPDLIFLFSANISTSLLGPSGRVFILGEIQIWETGFLGRKKISQNQYKLHAPDPFLLFNLDVNKKKENKNGKYYDHIVI